MQEIHPLHRSTRLFIVVLWTVIAAGCVTTPALLPRRPPEGAPQRESVPPPPARRAPIHPPRPAPVAKARPAAKAHPSMSAEASSHAPRHTAAARKKIAVKAAEGALERKVSALMRAMTLEEKVGQLFVLELGSIPGGELYRNATPAAIKIITTYHPGGIILFGGNIDTIDQTVALIRGVQAASRIPLFVAVDEEGGTVSRLTASGNMHAVHMPAAAVVGETDDPKLAEREGRYIGMELRSLGINMDLAPVADLRTNPRNTVIGTRAFSANSAVAARMARAVVDGLQSVEVSSVIKHFPGHGATSGDSHQGAAVVHRTLAQLRKLEFRPFEAGIAAGADGVMIGHLLLPEILPQKRLPATFSPYVLGTLLRNQLGFKKIIMTDALNMGAIVDYWGPGAAAVDAFDAGADMLLMPQNRAAAFRAILTAVESDEIPMRRLDESVRRILTVKFERGIIGGSLERLDPHRVFGSAEGRKIRSEIEARASAGP